MVLTINKGQEATLRALMETIIAPLDDDEAFDLVLDAQGTQPMTYSIDDVDDEKPRRKTNVDLSAMAASSGTDVENSVGLVLDVLERSTHRADQTQLLLALKALNTNWGCALLTGHRRPFAELTRAQREQALLRWKASPILRVRQFYRMINVLTTFVNFSHSDILRASTGYPYPLHTPPAPSKPVVDVYGRSTEPYKMLGFYEANDLQSYRFDAIIVGSGGGGGVIAAQIAAAGKSVLVLEKGKYYLNEEFGPDEATGLSKTYEASGFLVSKEGTCLLLAGSTWGGGTTINWGATLDPPQSLLDEWSEFTGGGFDPEVFKQDLATVRERIGASTVNVEYSNPNKIIQEGCKKLGLPEYRCGINSRGIPHDCKLCFVGCRDGIKQGTANSWLRDAEADGARFMDQTEVTKVLIQNGKAIGVECLVKGSTKFTFKSKLVVVAGGSLHTPNILRRSGLRNRHIGRNLRLHLSTVVMGYYDTPQDPFEGNILTTVSNVPNNDSSDHHGAKVEVPSLLPALNSVLHPWRGCLHFKQTMAKYHRAAPMLILGNDRDSVNSVTEQDGHVSVSTHLSKHDEQSLINGVIRAYRILAVTGARELHHSQYVVEPFIFDKGVTGVDAVKDPKFLAWLDRVRQGGIPDVTLTAHQMGSCRMGKDAQSSVCQPTGETWEIENLYVGDSSLFVTSSGVNPMLTVETLAYGVGRHIVKRLQKL
ncbi:uncharacterized protein BX664DRAFT_374273 [Halteromyces radiatus]|uniref:uncharacterized protein n=1 Tax=Halteromyces radiatus TaxID=101107 RepID=UPI00221F7546|nr:uncharacterized protein BX664DRAFT_374273 [Halteromyces radiatus]KAI8086177.1 hypothetical protein BX664DRAFT_374273 [Halteromyces radiatus]